MDELKDYYEVMQLSPNADRKTIEKVFRLLAKRYHPDNAGSGDTERFSQLTEAYHVLADDEKRAAYDARYDEVRAVKAGVRRAVFAEGSVRDGEHIRHGILSTLYIARRRNARSPGVGIVTLEQVLECVEEQMEFHIWYLREKGLIERTDTGTFAITAEGVDVIEAKQYILRKDRLLQEPERTGGDGCGRGCEISGGPDLLPLRKGSSAR
ncbi:MAG: DnaJ domain-containing protein [Desulfobacteraceae bacterium]|nr:DnaJ domain-containing protein [Desulfobacteraceae bacterium]